MSLDSLNLDHLSPSSISTYLDSPLRWKQHYIGGIKDGYSDSLHRGIVVHEVLESYFRKVLVGETPSDVSEFTKTYVPAAWQSVKEDHNGDFEDDPKAITGIELLVADYLITIGQKLKPLGVEVPFVFPIGGKKLKKMIGRIDLIAMMGDQLWVIDFKTSGRKKSNHDVKNDPQAIIYGLAVRHNMGVTTDVPFSYHQLIFKKEPEISLLDRPVSVGEMNEFSETFLPQLINTIEWQVETDNFYFNPNARYGKGT